MWENGLKIIQRSYHWISRCESLETFRLDEQINNPRKENETFTTHNGAKKRENGRNDSIEERSKFIYTKIITLRWFLHWPTAIENLFSIITPRVYTICMNMGYTTKILLYSLFYSLSLSLCFPHDCSDL